MADRVTRRKKKDEKATMAPQAPMTKLEKEVTHWLKRNLATKKTKFLHSHEVSFFSGIKAVDALLNDSPWSKLKVANPDTAELVFDSRERCVEFLDDLLRHKMFHRAKKIPVVDPVKPGRKKNKKVEEKTDGEETDKGAKKGEKEGSKDKEVEDKRKKRKIRLDMHLDQIFLDTSDAYVWLYDPVPWYYWGVGTVIVLGVIGVCLFPLWPPQLRLGVHYLSIAAAGFLVFIIGLAIFKYILFGILFALSGGKLKFWLFPNLTEDVGFMESFLPIYDYTYTGASFRRKKEKDSDSEESDDEEEEKAEKANQADNSESDESTSKKSSTGKDFELVDKNDTDEIQDD